MIITISREYGSGGRKIGKELSVILNIPYFDREIVTQTAHKSGYSEEILKRLEKRPANKLLYSAITGASRDMNGQTLDEQLFEAEAKVIREIASQGSAVIVGRCADFVLENTPDKFDFFIFGTEEYRIKNIAGDDYEKIEHQAPKMALHWMDRRRAAYYQYFTGKIWGQANHYDLCISPEHLGIHGTALFLSQYVKDVLAAKKA